MIDTALNTESHREITIERKLLAYLDTLGIRWQIERHAPLHTVAESKAATAHLPGAHTKNLFLKDKKGAVFLVTCLEDRQIRIRDLERAIGAKRLSFGSTALLYTTLGVRPGAVTPFALFNDRSACSVTLILDQQMMAIDPQNFHPLHNEATLTVSPDGLRTFVAATGHSVQEVDFDALEQATKSEIKG